MIYAGLKLTLLKVNGSVKIKKEYKAMLQCTSALIKH